MLHRSAMIRLTGLAILTLALAGFAGPPASAQVAAKITGTVVDVDGQPVAKAVVSFETVQVEGRPVGLRRTVKTRKNGGYTIPFLDPGTYRVVPEIDGYKLLKLSAISIDSQKNPRYSHPDNASEPLTTIIQADGANVPAIPVAPQGQGALVSGKCEIDFVVVKEEDYSSALRALQSGKAPAAAKVDTKAIERKRDPVERGDEYFAGGDFEAAAAAYRDALEADPERIDAQYGLGKSLFRMDDYGGAQAALMAAQRLDPEMPGVNFYLANIYHALAQDAAAIAALEKERVNSPDSEEVLENLASLYVETGKLEPALEVVQESLALNPENTDARLLEANIHDKLGHKEQAEEIYRAIVAENPAQADIIWYNIGVNAYNADKKNEAATAFENSVKANPKNADAHRMLGYTLIGLNRSAEAVDHFERYLKLEPKGQYAAEVSNFLSALERS